ncbi:cornifelin-like [Diadema antillarum]|uniref:cornifelin-like n=1 Tax=Diadema antillarum TaxID=105358 RepID=UPI003A8B35BD
MTTTVVMQQPVAGQVIQMTTTSNPLMPRGVPRDWSTSLFDCFSDIPVCLLGFFFEPCHLCCVATDMNENCCTAVCLPAPLLSMRALHRGRHNVQGTLMNDCCTSTFCGPCAQCQLHREVKGIKDGRVQA